MKAMRGTRRAAIGLLGLMGVLAASDAGAGTYRWIDKDGTVRYTDRPPQPSELAPSQPTPPKAVVVSPAVNELMDLSGLRQQLQWVALATRADLQTRLGTLAAEERASVDRVAATAFAAERLQSLVVESLSAGVDDGKLMQALIWFRTPAGKKIAAAETAAGMPQAQKEIAAFAQARTNNPTDPKRLERLRSIDEVAGTSEFTFDAVMAVAEGLRRGVEPYLPVERRRSVGNIDSEIANARVKALEQLKTVTLTNLEFCYREISDADLDAYIAFLGSPGGRWLTIQVHQALLHAVRTSTQDAIGAIAEVIPPHTWGQPRSRPAPSRKTEM